MSTRCVAWRWFRRKWRTHAGTRPQEKQSLFIPASIAPCRGVCRFALTQARRVSADQASSIVAVSIDLGLRDRFRNTSLAVVSASFASMVASGDGTEVLFEGFP